jgi:hypothetical protein
MTALDHRRPDRMPIFDSFWEEFRRQCARELRLAPEVDLADHFEVDIGIAVADETPFPTRRQVLQHDGHRTVERDGWGRVIETVAGAFFYREIEVAVAEKADLDRVRFDPPDLDLRYEEFGRCVEAWRPRRCVFCKTGGPYLRTTFLRGEVNFLVDIASDPPFAKDLADRVADHIIAIGLESLRRGRLYDTGLWIYDDMAHNHQPMMSPDAFERIFLPAYSRMVAAFKQAGAAKVVLHSDGFIGPLLDMLVAAGIDGINPVEPRTGLHIPALKARYGDRLSLIGGMCNSHVLPDGPEAAIRAQVRQIVEAGRDGGVVIGAHSIGPDIPVQHYLCYHRAVRELFATA